jgi:hypothetical protein
VQLFGGLRPYEAARLQWERIHFDTGQIEVLAETSKTRETRFVELEPLLTEWLLPFRLPDGLITGPLFAKTLRAVKAAAGFTFGEDQSRPWPKDVLRHCYGSYWLAVHKDRAHLAELMGNSLQVIKTHYKRAIPSDVAEGFWKLTPAQAPSPGKIIPVPATAWSGKEKPGLSTKDSHMSEMEGQIQFLQRPMPEFPTLLFRFAKTLAETPACLYGAEQSEPGRVLEALRLNHRAWRLGAVGEERPALQVLLPGRVQVLADRPSY